MDEQIRSLRELTSALLDRLPETSYEELELFVEQRQELIDSLQSELTRQPATGVQKDELRQILEHDGAIRARMNGLRLEAQDWLQKRNQAKRQRSAYEAGYSPDSILMDRKK